MILSAERKTRLQAVATFVLATAALSWIGTDSSDFVKGLPDWLEAPAYAALLALAGFLTGYVTKHRPDALSASAVAALRYRVRGDH